MTASSIGSHRLPMAASTWDCPARAAEVPNSSRCIRQAHSRSRLLDWFLFADGSVGRGEQLGRVSVRVSERDKNQLVKLRAFLGSTHTIGAAPAGNYGGYRSKPSVRLSVRSVRLAQRLLSLGRYEGPIDGLLVQSRDFWRGIVDGDGSLGILATGYAYFELVGSRRLLEACLSFLKSNELSARMTIRAGKTIFQIATAGLYCREVTGQVYSTGCY